MCSIALFVNQIALDSCLTEWQSGHDFPQAYVLLSVTCVMMVHPPVGRTTWQSPCSWFYQQIGTHRTRLQVDDGINHCINYRRKRIQVAPSSIIFADT